MQFCVNSTFNSFARRCSFNFSLDNPTIFVESALYALHSAARAHPKLFADHSNESFVVRYEYHTAAELGDSLPERFDGFNVKMIRRFVENEEVWQC